MLPSSNLRYFSILGLLEIIAFKTLLFVSFSGLANRSVVIDDRF